MFGKGIQKETRLSIRSNWIGVVRNEPLNFAVGFGFVVAAMLGSFYRPRKQSKNNEMVW